MTEQHRSAPSQTPEDQVGAYAAAGVSIDAADRAIDLMKAYVEKARRPEVIGGLGGFAGLFDATALTRYTQPLLATATDGVGTKVAIAQMMDIHDTIGFDLVGMVVDDLVVCGAEPLFMTDYIACGRVVPERIAAIVKGIAEACVMAGCALIGGETAEHPGLLDPDDYDLAGATTGVVEASKLLGPGRVRPGRHPKPPNQTRLRWWALVHRPVAWLRLRRFSRPCPKMSSRVCRLCWCSICRPTTRAC